MFDFVADGGDDGYRRGGDGAHDAFVVEDEQVLERSAAAGQHDQVRRVGVRRAQRADDLRRHIALHRRLEEPHINLRRTSARLRQKVARSVTTRRTHQRDAKRIQRNRPLALRAEQAFGVKLAAQRLELRVQLADAADEIEMPHNELILTALLED